MNSPLLTLSSRTFILLLLLSGCAVSPPGKQAPVPSPQLLKEAQQAERTGAYEQAAQHYLQLATDSQGAPQSQTYRLRAVNALLHGNFIRQAQHILGAIDTNRLNPGQQAQKSTLAARIALAQNQPHTASKLLSPVDTSQLPAELAAAIQELRAQAYLREGKLLEAVRARVALGTLLPATDSEHIHSNQILLWQTLQQLPDDTLHQLRVIPPADERLRGWLALARIARQSQDQAQQVPQLLADWRLRYPHHPAAADIIASLQARQVEAIHRPQQIALLLPHTGAYAKPAAALRDGFLAAYFQRSDRHYQPTIRIYDSGSDTTATMTSYEQAIKDGADFVVGPLKKDAVTRLAAQERLAVSTLSLNYSPQTGHSPDNLYQFGLAPEDEARQVAERAWLDGNNRAIALVPEGNWGQRLLDSFRDDWVSLGGKLEEFQFYPPAENDFSHPIQAVLNIDDSKQRHREIEHIVQQKLAFQPRRRQDVDFIFLAAFPRQARLIRPQLKFYYAGGLPVYATSHIFSTRSEASNDRDMDGIIFCDIPWVLPPVPPLKQTISHLWPETADQYSRFYALGLDAYHIIPALKNMQAYHHERFSGETGTLSLGDGNRIFRELSWARFKRGLPRPY